MGLVDGPNLHYYESLVKSESNLSETHHSMTLLASIGPEQWDWFEEHCPEWKQHLSLVEVHAQYDVDDLMMIRHTREQWRNVVAVIREELRRRLLYQIEQHFVPKPNKFAPSVG